MEHGLCPEPGFLMRCFENASSSDTSEGSAKDSGRPKAPSRQKTSQHPSQIWISNVKCGCTAAVLYGQVQPQGITDLIFVGFNVVDCQLSG